MAGAIDVLVPTFDRPAMLHRLLSTGLALGLTDVRFVVIDDGSTAVEEVPGLGTAATAEVAAAFGDAAIVDRNETNLGLAESLRRYFARREGEAEYTLLVNDKDVFVDGTSIESARRKLDADAALSMVMIPLRQVDRDSDDRELPFDYPRMTGEQFVSRYVHDVNLQHAGGYALMRASRVRAAGVPRPLGLRSHGLEDAFGVDIDLVLMTAVTGDVEFERVAHLRRSVVGGLTEAYPLTFAYSYYQYVKRTMSELRRRRQIASEDLKQYVGWWLLLIARGLVVAYRPVHETHREEGTKRIRGHLKAPILLYLPWQLLRFRIRPSEELTARYRDACRLMWARGGVSGLLERVR